LSLSYNVVQSHVRLTFVQLPGFVADALRLGLDDEDFAGIEQTLLENANAGAVMAGTGGLRKMRWAPRRGSGGKSGGVRVGYVLFRLRDTVVLVLAFGKNEKANLTAVERKAVKAVIDRYRKFLEAQR
jgi:hypothetical protein